MTTYGKSTEQDEFESELHWNMKTLEKGIELLGSREDKKFAQSLCDWYQKHGNLSPKQMFRAMQFWQEVNSLGAVQQGPDSRGVIYKSEGKKLEPKPEVKHPVVRADGKAMLALFDKAAEKLKYPHITFHLDPDVGESVNKIKFFRTGIQSKKPGTILITNGIPYPQGMIYAQIERDGTTVWHQRVWGMPEFMQSLKVLIEDPAQQFKINGQRFSSCCYCGIELTDPRSIAMGYGPICAANWGLPWGEIPEDDDTLLASL